MAQATSIIQRTVQKSKIRGGSDVYINTQKGRYEDHWAESEHFFGFFTNEPFFVSLSRLLIIYIDVNKAIEVVTPFRTPFTKREGAQRVGMLANPDRSESSLYILLSESFT